jgi:hypothetical protein
LWVRVSVVLIITCGELLFSFTKSLLLSGLDSKAIYKYPLDEFAVLVISTLPVIVEFTIWLFELFD